MLQTCIQDYLAHQSEAALATARISEIWSAGISRKYAGKPKYRQQELWTIWRWKEDAAEEGGKKQRGAAKAASGKGKESGSGRGGRMGRRGGTLGSKKVCPSPLTQLTLHKISFAYGGVTLVVSDMNLKFKLEKMAPGLRMTQGIARSGVILISMRILAPVAGKTQGKFKRVVAVRLWWIETQNKAFPLAFRNPVVSVFKFGSNWRYFGWIPWNLGHHSSCRNPLLCPTRC